MKQSGGFLGYPGPPLDLARYPVKGGPNDVVLFGNDGVGFAGGQIPAETGDVIQQYNDKYGERKKYMISVQSMQKGSWALRRILKT